VAPGCDPKLQFWTPGRDAFTSVLLMEVDLGPQNPRPQSSAAWNSRAPKSDFLPLFLFYRVNTDRHIHPVFNHTSTRKPPVSILAPRLSLPP
jgi:hypothetical protein